jgi:two-component system, NtrC family, nitrogen regulation sensor histidine kinase NtrY
MTFRRKLMTVFSLVVFVSVAGVAVLVSAVTRRVFERNEEERTAALVTQFRREFNRQGEIVAARVEAIAASDAVNRMALALNRVPGDAGPYFELAKTTAENNQLDFLEFVESDGTIVSSAQSPEKFASAEESIASLISAAGQSAYLKQELLQDGVVLGWFAVRATRTGEHPVDVIGGRRLDKTFLSTLDMPTGMRVLLYQNRGNGFSAESIVDPESTAAANLRPANKLEPIVDAALQSKQELTRRVEWSGDAAEDEEFHAIPLMGRTAGGDRPPLAVLLIGNSRRTYVELMEHIRSVAIFVGGGGIALAILLSSWAAARVTRPVEKLASAVQEVAGGNWNIYVEVNSADEIGRLADSFNRMTTELLGQKERLVQAERVAAWRELARRLAHELKNPLFPLQLTVENLIRTRQQQPEEFEDAFRESSRTLLAEIANLKEIIGKFNDFSKMPQPQLKAVQVNEVVRSVMQLFQTQLDAPGRAKIACEMNLNAREAVMADAELLHRATSNLVLNAIEAMPQGGTLTLRTRDEGGNVIVEVADTGLGLEPEEREKIFTPYYTNKRHGTGLGLAIVQSIVSDHGGRIRVQSEAGRGATFVIELQQLPEKKAGSSPPLHAGSE